MVDHQEKKGQLKLRPLLTLWPFVMRYKIRLFFAFVALVIAAAATLAIPMAVRRVIDFGFSVETKELIDVYFAVMLVVVFVLAIASATRYYLVNVIGERVVADLRQKVFAHVIGLSPAFHDSALSGEIISRLTADTTQIKSAVGSSMSVALRNLFLLVGAVVMMIYTSGKLSALALGAIPLIVIPMVMFGRSVRRRSRFAQDTLADASAYANEQIGAVRTIQAFTNEIPVIGHYSRAVDNAYDAVRASSLARAFLTAFAISLVFASVVGVLWYGAQDVVAGNLSGGALGQFVLYAVFAASSMGQLSEVWGEIQLAAGAAERLTELLRVNSDITQPDTPKPLPAPEGRIVFENVNFAFPGYDDRPVLHDISFAVAPGETVAIVGPSGAGKSTLFHLLLRYYDPDSGRILLDGVDLREGDLNQIRGRMALVPQDAAIFATSIGENIHFGNLAAPTEDIMTAARDAHADEFISTLNDGYETPVGERGITLSGGQKQRIAIARAILRDTPILLLDEATSALDAESETLVQEALERLMEGRTTLVIAHRLATIQRADRILVLDQGRIVEEGTHKSLRAKKGLYARLAKLQFDGKQAAE
ncbi:MAG: ATP-binding cassette domain-containing protein [Fimbriimonadaceae bacterium]|nr:ATP-binding cassette domain-containing protein [Alphaproteobacteria bacterium]